MARSIHLSEMWNYFVQKVAMYFGFLETEYGFVCSSTKPPFVNFESSRLRVLVYYDHTNRHELDLAIKRLDHDSRQSHDISVGSLIRLRDGQDSASYEEAYPNSEAELDRELSKLAGLLREYGPPLIAGDMSVFDRFDKIDTETQERLAAKYKWR